jgi:hypothetical protein
MPPAGLGAWREAATYSPRQPPGCRAAISSAPLPMRGAFYLLCLAGQAHPRNRHTREPVRHGTKPTEAINEPLSAYYPQGSFL